MTPQEQQQTPEIFHTLGRIEAKLDATKESLEKLTATVEKQNGRVGRLEAFRNRVYGMAAVGTTMITFLVIWIQSLLPTNE